MKTIIVFALFMIAFTASKSYNDLMVSYGKCSTELNKKLATPSDQNVQDYATWNACVADVVNRKNCIYLSGWLRVTSTTDSRDIPEFQSGEIVGCAKDCTKLLKGADVTAFGNCVMASSAFVLKISLVMLSILAFFF